MLQSSGTSRRIRAQYRNSLGMSLRQWLEYHQRDLAFDQCTWMGVKAWKNPLDAWIYQEIVYEVRPEVIVEVGSAMGGGTLYLAHLLDLLGDGTVVSVDIDRTRFVAEHQRIVTVTGNSSSPEGRGARWPSCAATSGSWSSTMPITANLRS